MDSSSPDARADSADPNQAPDSGDSPGASDDVDQSVPDQAALTPGRSAFALNRSGVTVILAGVLLMLTVGVAAALPVPYVSLSPGPMFNTLGEVDGKRVVDVKGNAAFPTYPTSGNLDMTTISERGGPSGGMSILTALRGWFNSDIAVVPREAVYPDDVDPDEVQAQNAEAFSTSQSNAIAAGLNEAKVPVTPQVTVTAVAEGAPAQGNLKAGDHILTMNGKVVKELDDVVQPIVQAPIGTKFAFEVTRRGETKTTKVSATSAKSPSDPTKPYIGIEVGYNYVGPFPVTINLQDVGGPSAGLMFALSIVDQLTPQGLNGGKYVAGTGTIEPDGTVGPIGGIVQKIAAARLAGADIFLAPADNCPDATKADAGSMPVVKISTLDEAVAALDTWRTKGPDGLTLCGS